jgi:murein DD-endopeptidase MepM/ murein hydrolase activator NlpD
MAKKVKVTVKKGDTLSAIAKANNTTVAKIAAANPQITNVNKISVNQKITLPPATTTKPKSSTPIVTMGANTSGQFAGPIPTGTTRTATGYEAVPTSVDAIRNALTKLTSGGVLTDAERILLGMTPVKSSPDKIDAPDESDDDAPDDDDDAPDDDDDAPDDDDDAPDESDDKGTKQKTKEEYDAEQRALAEAERKANERRDAFAAIEATIKSYGFNESELKEINEYLTRTLINPKIGPNQALLDMRNLQAYKTRFAGNETLAKNGFNRLSEADYLQQEDAYGQKLTEYGVGSLGNRAQFATLIGNRVSVTEVGKRAALAVDRVKNADPAIMTTLKRFYTGITDADLVGYFLNPKEQLPELERKVVTGEIGAASKEYGLNDLSLARAQEFAALGIDQAGARKGYEQIAEKLPRGSFLSSISPEDQIAYNQELAEDATLKGTASAKRKEEQLKAKEITRFLGSSGAAKGAFSTGYLNKSSTAGLY